jgi:SOS-response transcriptional repressor LexA
MKDLTARQAEILKYIIAYRETNRVSPTFREIAQHFDITFQTVQSIAGCIRKKGFLTWESGKARTIKPMPNRFIRPS